MVKAVLRPMSLFTLQLLAGLQMLAMSAIPEVIGLNYMMHATNFTSIILWAHKTIPFLNARSTALYFKHCTVPLQLS